MKYRKLGDSDLVVSEVSLGSWLTYSGGVERSNAEACVRRALERGVNLLDTANIYGRGAAETFLGEVLREVPRKDYLLATKLYFPMTDTDRGLSRAQVKKQLDASLKRLRVDYVDLYQCHRYDSDTPLAETMEALTEAVKAGKTRYVGVSEWTAAQLRAAREVPGAVRLVSNQPQYSMLYREIEREVLPESARQGIGQIVWSPLAQGVLTGKYLPGRAPPRDSRAGSGTMGGFLPPQWLEAPVLKAVQALEVLARSVGLTTAQLALAWVLRQPGVSSAIVGASRPEQVDDNVKASGVVLSEETLAAAEVLLRPVL
ncbi:MAG: aldo/keto reductase family protein [Deltaproteobacteria bacterium]|nr:aldo/keto reductase family protein [Deltaproteobacteria bacterium]